MTYSTLRLQIKCKLTFQNRKKYIIPVSFRCILQKRKGCIGMKQIMKMTYLWGWCKICSVTRFLSIYFFCFRGCLDHCCNTSSSSDKLVDFDLQPNGWPGYDETSCWFVEIETAGRRNKMAPERRRGSLCWLLLVLFNMTTIIIHKKTNMNIVIHRMNKAVCCFNKTMEA